LQTFYEHRVKEINKKIKEEEAELIAKAEAERIAREEERNSPSRKTSYSQFYSIEEYNDK